MSNKPTWAKMSKLKRVTQPAGKAGGYAEGYAAGMAKGQLQGRTIIAMHGALTSLWFGEELPRELLEQSFGVAMTAKTADEMFQKLTVLVYEYNAAHPRVDAAKIIADAKPLIVAP